MSFTFKFLSSMLFPFMKMAVTAPELSKAAIQTTIGEGFCFISDIVLSGYIAYILIWNPPEFLSNLLDNVMDKVFGRNKDNSMKTSAIMFSIFYILLPIIIPLCLGSYNFLGIIGRSAARNITGHYYLF